jgi:hypothetical protein
VMSFTFCFLHDNIPFMADIKYSGCWQQIESKYPTNVRCIIARYILHYPASLPLALRQVCLEQAVFSLHITRAATTLP